ncbi:hypothetical protein QJS10_CPB14g01649 [Acorus calamus]|uniref:Protein YIP n=1 Tax=Acorus calamus TaxID=4465 RepID=A0AAV9DBU0_ACOCL|nr:hypothetical protein QJS10_CPB14g01649 [Acorus calamus]
MDEGYASLPSSHLLGSVPAVIGDDGKDNDYTVPEANLQIFPPGNGGNRSSGSGTAGDQQASSSWTGIFSISSYSPYFDVDTEDVVDRIMNSLYPTRGNFFRKIDGNPDLYGPLWISTTLVFILAALGNCATYLMDGRSDPNTAWNFDVSYVNWAASVIYGYVILLPAAFYFLLQYFGSPASLVRLWCMWGYSLFVFVPSCLLLVVPAEIFRWIVILVAGSASSCFVGLNLKSYVEGSDLLVVVVSASVLQLALTIFIKAFFFA